MSYVDDAERLELLASWDYDGGTCKVISITAEELDLDFDEGDVIRELIWIDSGNVRRQEYFLDTFVGVESGEASLDDLARDMLAVGNYPIWCSHLS